MNRFLIWVVTIYLLAQANMAWAALMVQEYDPARHDRFYVGANKAFVGDPYDWSAVGLTNEGTWATAISPSYFISANHFHPDTGESLRFFQGNDPAGPFEDHTVASGTQISTTDLWIGKLSTPFSSEIDIMPVLRLTSNSDYLGREIYIMGKSDTSPPQTNMRMGRNIIDFVSDIMVWHYDAVGGLGADEAGTRSGDSGSGSFTIFDGVPALLGTHTGGNYDSFVPRYINEINAVMIGEQLTVLPEPSTIHLMYLGMVAALLARRAAKAKERA